MVKPRVSKISDGYGDGIVARSRMPRRRRGRHSVPGLELLEYGPCLVGGTVKPNDVLFTTKLAAHSGGDAIAPYRCVVLLEPRAEFSSPPSPSRRSARGIWLGFPCHSAKAFPSVAVICVFPGCRAYLFRGVEADFERDLRSRIFDSCSSSWNRGFSEFPIFLHVRLIGVD